jgi:hypothetical protein
VLRRRFTRGARFPALRVVDEPTHVGHKPVTGRFSGSQAGCAVFAGFSS